LSHELSGNWITIGRAAGNTFQIADQSVSGRHCEILLRGNEVIVSDLNSTNGTFIKGERITKGILRPGQLLRLGQVDLYLEAAPSAALPAAGGFNEAAPAKPGIQPGAAARPARKYQVLFVDDDRALLEAISVLYEILGDKTWEIHRATTADQALALLNQKAVDLVVLDIGMPVLDGIQLLTLIHRRYPDVKKAVLTGSDAPGHRETCLANGAELFIRKPVSGEGMKAVFTALNELISWAQRKGFSGMLRQVGLSDVIQMECLGGNSSILEVRNQHMQGQIYIESGAIVHATAGTQAGEKAFYRLLSLTGGEFRLQSFQPPAERTVHGQWEYLLIEAARVHDEETTTFISKKADGAAQSPSPVPASAAARTEFHAVGDHLVEVIIGDGKWHPAEGTKTTSGSVSPK